MEHIPIERIADVGVITDLPAHILPPEAWSDSLNVRFRKKRASRCSGWAQVMGTPGVAPAWIMNIDNGGDSYWIYAESVGANSNVYAFNSGSHADISQGSGYTVSNPYDWNGTVFQGIPIVNHGQGDPQYWASYNLATDLADLSNWPSSTTAKVIRSFKNFLVALNITDGGGSHFHRVLWSDGAAPGTLPSSWDVTNAAVEANHRDLSDVNSGAIQDGMALQDVFAIYKSSSTWIMRYIGGQLIMATNQVLQTSGIMAARCVTPVTLPISKVQVHFVKSLVDLGIFNGQGFESVIDAKIRRKLNNDIDPIYYQNAYVVDNPVEDEAIFVYPMNGSQIPDMAVVWDYRDNKVYFREFTGTFAASGVVESAAAETWSSVSGTWTEQDPAKWQEATRQKVIIADISNTKLQQLDAAESHDGTGFSAKLVRRGLAVVGRDRQGEPVVDMRARKLTSRIWIKGSGGAINVRVGGEEYIDDEDDDGANITWLDYQTFDPSAGTRYLDFVVNTPFIAVEFSTTSSSSDPWSLKGYAFDLEVISEH